MSIEYEVRVYKTVEEYRDLLPLHMHETNKKGAVKVAKYAVNEMDYIIAVVVGTNDYIECFYKHPMIWTLLQGRHIKDKKELPLYLGIHPELDKMISKELKTRDTNP